MSALRILVVVIVAVIAALVRTAVLGQWTVRGLVADFLFALAILALPGFIHE